MSTFPASPSEFGDNYGEPTRVSGIAIAALVCALIFCVPGLGLIGVILGLVALVTMAGRENLRGRGIAIAAIVLGICISVGWGIGAYYVVGFVRELVAMAKDKPQETLVAGFAGDVAGFQSNFHGAGATLPEADVKAFLDEATKRWGAFKTMVPDENQQIQPKPGQPTLELKYVATFDSGPVPAVVEFQLADKSSDQLIKKLAWMEFIDKERGNLRFPALPRPPSGP